MTSEVENDWSNEDARIVRRDGDLSWIDATVTKASHNVDLNEEGEEEEEKEEGIEVGEGMRKLPHQYQ